MRQIGQWFRAAWIVLAVAGIVILLDQWTKQLVRDRIPEYTFTVPIDALGEYFVFEHVRNYGAAFGILQNQQALFTVIGIVVCIAILVYVRYIPLNNIFVRVLLGLQMGGAIGNLIDRTTQLDEAGRGYVTDFIKMGIPGVYYWPNYNIADMAIVCGVIGLGIYILYDDVQKQKAQRQENTQEGVTADSSSVEA